MATRPQTSALTTPKVSDDEITKFLQSQGYIPEGNGSSLQRMQVNGTTFIAGDDVYTYNARTNQPAFVARIVRRVEQFQGLWWTEDHARLGNRPHLAGQYSKSYFDNPEQARERNQFGDSCRECVFGPFLKQVPDDLSKCQWRGDLERQIIGPSGQLDGTEPIWSLTLSTTAMIEFVGTKRAKTAGSVSDYNFLHKLAKLGADENPDNPSQGMFRAFRAYENGGVVVEARLPTQTSQDGSRKWQVPSFEPIAIVDFEETEALAIEAAADDPDKRNSEPVNVTPDTELPF
jgi:hypothetical protein